MASLIFASILTILGFIPTLGRTDRTRNAATAAVASPSSRVLTLILPDKERLPPARSPAAVRLLDEYLARQHELRGFYRARLGPRADVEDLVQDLYEKIAGLAPREVRNPAALLHALAYNHMLDRLRQGRRGRARDEIWRRSARPSAGQSDAADEPDAEATLIARQRLERAGRALLALPSRTQEIFRLHKIEGLSHAQTAQRLGLSKKTVEKHMSAALAHLLATVDDETRGRCAADPSQSVPRPVNGGSSAPLGRPPKDR